MSRKKLIIIIVTALLVMGAAAAYYVTVAASPSSAPEAAVKPQVVREPLPGQIEIADTPEKRTQGLSGRADVPDDYGMLFVFDIEGRSGFWMKDMRVPIDIIWIATDGTIVHIEHSLSPDTYPEIFTPSIPARYVLETRAGYAQDHHWNHGTMLDLSAYQ